MSAASNAQVQNFVDDYYRPIAQQVAALKLQIEVAQSLISDVYANLTASNPSTTWTDSVTDGPPHMLQPSDVLSMNTYLSGLLQVITGTVPSGQEASVVDAIAGQWPIMQLAVSQPFSIVAQQG